MRAAPKTRGPALVEHLIAHLAGPDSPIGEPVPLGPDAVREAEHAAGVALSPSMAALLAFDHGWIDRAAGWFRGGALVALPAAEALEDWAGPLWPAYAGIVPARFPGRILPLAVADDTFRLLYLGDPDPHGEYPVLRFDQDDAPVLAVEAPGFDVWLGRALGVLSERAFAADQKATARRLWGRQAELGTWDLPRRLPRPVAGPPPGSVAHPPLSLPTPKKPRRRTDAQVVRALAEQAEAGDVARVEALVAEVALRGLGTGPLGDALCVAAHHDRPAVVAILLDAGAPPDARDRYGVALARASWTRDDQVQDLLLARGADPNGPSILGRTVLHDAVMRGRESLVRTLLAAGADPDRPDQYRLRPLDYALRPTVPDPLPPFGILDALMNAGASVSAEVPPLVGALERAPDRYVRRLLAAGADPDAPAAHLSRTALHVAFERCRDGLAPALIAAGADRRRPDDRGFVLDEVYGPAGEDVRPLQVSWAAVPDQRLTVRLRLAVLDPRRLDPPPTALRGAFWRAAGAAGLVGGAAVSVGELAPAGAPGFCERTLSFDLRGASPDFVRWLLIGLWGDGRTPGDDAGAEPGVRVVGLWAEGSADGASVITPDALRALRAAPWRLFRGAALPFPLTTGASPGIVVVPADAPTVGQVATIAAALRTWDETRAWWEPAGTSGWTLDWGEPGVRDGRVGLRLLDPGGRRGPPAPWGWRSGPREALQEVLAALHREIPLTGAELTLPSGPEGA